MSSGVKHALAQILPFAGRVRDELAGACHRIEIAGSVRRNKPDVGDLEIVAIPSFNTLGGNLLDLRLAELIREQRLLPLKGFRPPGWRYAQFGTRAGILIDLFLATPETWGVIYTVRTGSADFSHGLFAYGNRRGITSREARLVSLVTGKPFDTPEEHDVFNALGVRYVRPELRFDRTAITPAS